MGKLNWAMRAYALFLLCVATAIALPAQTFAAPQSGSVTPVVPNETIALPAAQTFETLHSFDGTDGTELSSGLVQGTDGNFYGTTAYGGANNNTTVCSGGCGTVFKITPGGTLTTLYSFCSQSTCTDGIRPYAGLVQATDGNFYGTTVSGGAGAGTVFKITPGGTLTTLHSFNGTDGGNPYAGLVQAADGNLYGTTYGGGASGDGTVFKITPSGTLTTLHSFDNTDGGLPEAALVQGTDGDFYGTTGSGGANAAGCGGYGCGTVFKITPSGTLTTLYSFNYDGAGSANPLAPLVQATDGNFYGTTEFGSGPDNMCMGEGCGTVFKITPGGTLTTLHFFCSQGGSDCTDGSYPYAGLVQGTDGDLYGTTYAGGTLVTPAMGICNNGHWNDEGCGTVFKITPSGTLTTLYNFCPLSTCSHGQFPIGGLVQATNGDFYGTTFLGGANLCAGYLWLGCGTVFSLSVGLGPFVETQPTSGWVGELVKILGTSLTGATRVTFNGHRAAFRVVSSSLITTTAPAGATTGAVEVVTPSGTLSSNVPFRVVPCPLCFSPMGPGGEGGDD
jgi:uncharacterized repeat protein (TIGR03803 family)